MKSQQVLCLTVKPMKIKNNGFFVKKKVLILRGPRSPLYIAVLPLIYVVRFFGFAPYEFYQDDLVPSIKNVSFTIIAAIIYSYIFYNFIRNLTYSTFLGAEDIVLLATERGKVILNYVVLMAHLFDAVRNQKNFTRTWNGIADFDECLHKKGHVRSESNTNFGMWIMIFFNLGIWLSVNQAGMHAFSEQWYNNVRYMILYVATAASLYKYVGMALFFGQRFKFLNKIAGRNEALMTKDGLHFEKDTRWIEVMFSELMTICEKFIADHSWSLFLWIFNLGIHSVTNLYFLCKWCTSKSSVVSYHIEDFFVWCLISWLLAFISQLVLVHWCCHFASTEANCMIFVLFDRRKYLEETGYLKSINLQSTLHLLNRKLKFLAAGCFNVNLPLFRTIVGVTTTYLVILMQLPDNRDGNTDHNKKNHTSS